jgi:hypothetical protein
MTDWTAEGVEDRLNEAADVLRRLPDQNVRGYFNVWPEISHSFADLVGAPPDPMRRPPPPAAAISRMEETLTWLHFLSAEDCKLVWMRAEGHRWKSICWRFGISRATAHRRWQYGLSVIALRLNRRPVPSKQGRARAIDKAARLSSRR